MNLFRYPLKGFKTFWLSFLEGGFICDIGDMKEYCLCKHMPYPVLQSPHGPSRLSWSSLTTLRIRLGLGFGFGSFR